MADPSSTVLSAVTSSSRQLNLLLRCISFAKVAQIRLSAEGIRLCTSEGSIMEAFVFLEKAMFTSYRYQTPDGHNDELPTFEISLTAILEILNIFALSDPAASSSSKRPAEFDAFAAHRLNRHSGLNAFSNTTLDITGTSTLTYEGEGSPLSIHMSENDVTTTCDLTTYTVASTEEIPFARDQIALKTIMRSASLLDTILELSSLNPSELTIQATPNPSSANSPHLSFISTGALGTAQVQFSQNTSSATPVLETFQCPRPCEATFKFSLIKSAQRAMGAATKVSLRLDAEGVLSLQFLVEMGESAGQEVAFVDFRVVPLVEGGGDVSSDGE